MELTEGPLLPSEGEPEAAATSPEESGPTVDEAPAVERLVVFGEAELRVEFTVSIKRNGNWYKQFVSVPGAKLPDLEDASLLQAGEFLRRIQGMLESGEVADNNTNVRINPDGSSVVQPGLVPPEG